MNYPPQPKNCLPLTTQGSFNRVGSARQRRLSGAAASSSPLRPSTAEGGGMPVVEATSTPQPGEGGEEGTATEGQTAMSSSPPPGLSSSPSHVLPSSPAPGPSTSVPDGRALPSFISRNPSASMSGFVPNQKEAFQGVPDEKQPKGMPSCYVLLYHSLVALQKLSLKRTAQSAIIREGLLPWLVDFLQVSCLPMAIIYRRCDLDFLLLRKYDSHILSTHSELRGYSRFCR